LPESPTGTASTRCPPLRRTEMTAIIALPGGLAQPPQQHVFGVAPTVLSLLRPGGVLPAASHRRKISRPGVSNTAIVEEGSRERRSGGRADTRSPGAPVWPPWASSMAVWHEPSRHDVGGPQRVPKPDTVAAWCMLSLIVGAQILTVSVRGGILAMRGQSRGRWHPAAGGAAQRRAGQGGSPQGVLATAGLFGAAPIHGDGVITPAILVRLPGSPMHPVCARSCWCAGRGVALEVDNAHSALCRLDGAEPTGVDMPRPGCCGFSEVKWCSPFRRPCTPSGI
jgi:hypothetical protein